MPGSCPADQPHLVFFTTTLSEEIRLEHRTVAGRFFNTTLSEEIRLEHRAVAGPCRFAFGILDRGAAGSRSPRSSFGAPSSGAWLFAQGKDSFSCLAWPAGAFLNQPHHTSCTHGARCPGLAVVSCAWLFALGKDSFSCLAWPAGAFLNQPRQDTSCTYYCTHESDR